LTTLDETKLAEAADAQNETKPAEAADAQNETKLAEAADVQNETKPAEAADVQIKTKPVELAKQKAEQVLIGGKPIYTGPVVRGNILFNGIPAFQVALRWRPYIFGLILLVWLGIFGLGGVTLNMGNIIVLGLTSLLGVATGYLFHCVYLSTRYYFFIILKLKMVLFAVSFLGLTLMGFKSLH